jgi:hypothetical protein
MSELHGIASPPDIATRAELDRLRETRPVPAPVPELAPNGPDANDVRRSVHEANESRLNDLQDRLQRVRDGAERDHSFARLHGHAKADFEQSR